MTRITPAITVITALCAVGLFACSTSGRDPGTPARLPAPPAEFRGDLKRAGYVLKSSVFMASLRSGEKKQFVTTITARPECRCGPKGRSQKNLGVCRGCFSFIAQSQAPMRLKVIVDDITDPARPDPYIAQSAPAKGRAAAGVCWDWDCADHMDRKRVRITVTAVEGAGRVQAGVLRLAQGR